MAKKTNSKTTSTQKHRRRQWLTFLRMCRYGVNNFSRNAWLSIAATAIMTITLFIVFFSVVARNIIVDTGDKVTESVDMSIYLATETTEPDAVAIADSLRQLGSVRAVTIETPAAARDSFINTYKDDTDALEAVKQATNRFPWTLGIGVVDINDTSELSTFVATNQQLKDHIDADRQPTFVGSKKAIIQRIASVVEFAQRLGIIASAVFVGVSMLIIFNTIRMAIFNRREEIQMMKLIGAERSFIRGPFVVEAIVYGFFGAVIASALGYGLLFLAEPALRSYDINIQPTIELLTYYAAFIVLAMIALGAIIGVISSLLATHRHLKL